MPSQKSSLKMIFAILMITLCPWNALGGSHTRMLRQHLEKNTVNSVAKVGSIETGADWIKISTGLPNSVILKAGETLELECEVLGSPPPNIKWLKDGKIFYSQEQDEIGNDVAQELFGSIVEEDEENNNLPGEAEVLRSYTGGLAKAISRLRIQCVTPKHQGVYTCLAAVPASLQMSNRLDVQDASMSQTALSSTMVHVRGRRTDVRSTGCSRGGRSRTEGAWIQEWWPVVMQMMGKGIVLSCHAEGRPKPTVSWLDSTGKPLPFGNSFDSRRRVLPTGELYISELHWEDMGGYTCLARNSLGKSSETTFLYPVRLKYQADFSME